MDKLETFIVILTVFTAFCDVFADRKEIPIVGLFDSEDKTLQNAFVSAVQYANSKLKMKAKTYLKAHWEVLPPNNSFEVANRVCGVLSEGVAAIFGPQFPVSAAHVQSVCDTFDMPHIETRWDPGLDVKVNSINLYPHPPVLSRAYIDLVHEWAWKDFAIIYENNDGLIRLRELFETRTRTLFTIVIRQLPPGDDYRTVLRDIKKQKKMRIIVDCSTENVFRVLKQAQQVGMMTDSHHYLMSNLDMDTVDLEDFRYGGTKITSFRLIDPERPEVMAARDYMKTSPDVRRSLDNNEFVFKTETALIFDAVNMFSNAINDLDSSQSIRVLSLSCETERPWSKSGTSLINYMKSTELTGLSGLVEFADGIRPYFELDIMELQSTGLVKVSKISEIVGYWSSQEKNKQRPGLNLMPPVIEPEIYDDTLRNKVLKITTLLTEPYTMIKESVPSRSGNDRYEGFCIDLVHQISLMLEFNYTIYEVEDKAHGNLNTTTMQWDGIIGEVKSGVVTKADLGIGDITITLERESVVDFTTPYMNLGISILYRKPEPAPPSFLSFLAPFSNDVWLYMCITYMGVSVTLFILARLSPDEWDNPYPCIQEPDVLKNDFGMMNSMWFTIGSLMQQGSDIAPKAASTRLVAGMWWLFTLIMISSYTATLTAFLTVETRDSPIKSVDDLANQDKIKYGCLDSGATRAFFNTSNLELYKKMWDFMYSNPSVFTKKPDGNKDGEERVANDVNYAFFMESNSIEYITERKCNLTQVGGLLDDKGYGIALKKDSPYRNDLTAAILHLKENGTLQALKTKWWKQMRGGGQCKDSTTNPTKPLGLPNVSGIFVVLLGGLAVSSFAAFMEFFWKTRKVASDERESLCKEMVKELKFAMSCKNSKKLTKKRPPSEPENGMAMPLAKYGFGDADIFT